MRYCPHSVDFIKSKAKLLKRYLSDPLMEAPALSLTEVQGIIAQGLGFSTWAEMTAEINRAPGRPNSVVSDAVFSRFAIRLKQTIRRSEDLCAALIFRIGFCPDSPDLSTTDKPPTVSECGLLFDIILDRLVELDPQSLDYDAARSRLMDLHRQQLKQHVAEWRNWDARTGAFHRGVNWDQRQMLLEWVGAVINMTAHPEPQLVQRTVDSLMEEASKIRLPKYRMLTPERLVAPFERGDIAQTGLLVMTGGNGSGRTFSSIMLTLANRSNQRVLFPTFTRLYNDPLAGGLPQGYVGEIRELSDYKAIARDAEKQLVIVQLAAGGAESAYHRTCQGLQCAIGSGISDWVRRNFIGGYHHSFGDRCKTDGLRDSIVSFWKAEDAYYPQAGSENVVVSDFTML